jgi:hypothetical protein
MCRQVPPTPQESIVQATPSSQSAFVAQGLSATHPRFVHQAGLARRAAFVDRCEFAAAHDATDIESAPSLQSSSESQAKNPPASIPIIGVFDTQPTRTGETTASTRM